MPLVEVSLLKGKSDAYRKAVGDVIHDAMVSTINCPPKDRFQLISQYDRADFIYAPEYLGITHTDELIVIKITLNEGRTVELKQLLFKTIAEQLFSKLGVGQEDVVMGLVEVKKENWSFGNGIAQYV